MNPGGRPYCESCREVHTGQVAFFGGHVSSLEAAIKVLSWWGLKPSPCSQSQGGPIWLPAITSVKIMGDCSLYAKSYFDSFHCIKIDFWSSHLCTTPGGSTHRGYQAVKLTQDIQQRRGIQMGLCTLYLQSIPQQYLDLIHTDSDTWPTESSII